MTWVATHLLDVRMFVCHLFPGRPRHWVYSPPRCRAGQRWEAGNSVTGAGSAVLRWGPDGSDSSHECCWAWAHWGPADASTEGDQRRRWAHCCGKLGKGGEQMSWNTAFVVHCTYMYHIIMWSTYVLHTYIRTNACIPALMSMHTHWWAVECIPHALVNGCCR